MEIPIQLRQMQNSCIQRDQNGDTQSSNTSTWMLQEQHVDQTSEWKHLGINQSKIHVPKSSFNIEETIDNVRRTYFGIT